MRPSRRACPLTALLLLATACGRSEEAAPPTPDPTGAPTAASAPPAALPPDAQTGLPDLAAERGLDYVNRSGSPEKTTVLEANGPGVALIDLSSDGDLDVVFSQGLGSLDELLAGPGADLAVYENDGGGHFRRLPGPGLSGWWTGLAAGDVDGDGDTDLVAGGFGALRVVLQEDGGTLVPGADLAPTSAGARILPGQERAAGSAPAWVTSLAVCDLDRDGRLDLYVGQYLELDPVDPPLERVGEGELALPCRWKGQTVYCGPHGLVPQPDRVLRGRGDGSFEDVSARWLPGHVAGFTLGVATFDADGDRDTDLFVANDSTANLMLVNQGDGRLVDFGFASGVALSADGAAEAGMGIAVGDVDRNGLPDLAVTNFSGEPTALYFGAAAGYSNETYRWGLNRASKALLSWSAHFTDFDGDGWLELFTANGHVYPQADSPGTGTSYGQADSLWFFARGREVLAVEPDERSVLWPRSGSRGAAVGDLDGDGRPDLVIARIDAPAALGLNRMGADAGRLEVRCLGPAKPQGDGPRTPADALGAVVLVTPRTPAGAEPVVLRADVQTAVGYQSSSSPWPVFGLGASPEAESVRVLWPSGATEVVGPVPANRRIVVREGAGIVSTEALP